MDVFYVVEFIDELSAICAGMVAALTVLTCLIFSFPKDES